MGHDISALVAGARDGRNREVARLLSLIEDASPQAPDALRLLAAPGHARVVGITGAPGVGKSTTTGALISTLRAQGRRVAVLAVDPSSPFSKGALLGDRIRMQDHATDEGVFIRSMAARGHLGGLAATTPQVLRVLDAAGFDDVLIETVGVGQSEIDIAAMADTTLVLVAPGMGDGIQAAKAGILEVGDVFVVNKADREGSERTVRELRSMLAMAQGGDWRPPVLPLVAVSGEGLPELLAAIDAHARWLEDSGAAEQRRRDRARDEIEALALATLRARLRESVECTLEELAAQVAAGTMDPYAAADDLVRQVTIRP
ncbi:MAG: methylmalonyl Co-A mutase-associated GTPase MeaB [Candidatus Nanopelagicales bacterium]|nr:methylmalonyl Co-A mutase-associated GTPase MeaB [Candidatus Nanopelagicales bacterium]